MTSKLTVNMIVAFLGLTAILTIVGGFVLSMADKSIPDALIALGSAGLGALGTLLARTSTEPVNTTNIVADTVQQPEP